MPELLSWWRSDEAVGVATVVGTFKSAPRQVGSAMVVGPGGTVVGSVSGGCVEGAVYDLAQQVVTSGRPVLARYGVSDEGAFAVGLTCGGTVEVYVEKVSRVTFPELDQVVADLAADRSVAVATVIEHHDPTWLGRRIVIRNDGRSGSLGSRRADDAVHHDGLGLLASGQSGKLTYGPDGERRGEGMAVFVTAYAARPVFATSARFPDADEVVVDWPHRYLQAEQAAGRIDAQTVITLLTHDPKFDVPLLEVALRLPEVGYVGAMGSRRTHEDRMGRRLDRGLTGTELARLSSPIGLDLGGRTPEETAVSIAAEIIAHRWGGSGSPLANTEGPIHEAADLSTVRTPRKAVKPQPTVDA